MTSDVLILHAQAPVRPSLWTPLPTPPSPRASPPNSNPPPPHTQTYFFVAASTMGLVTSDVLPAQGRTSPFTKKYLPSTNGGFRSVVSRQMLECSTLSFTRDD